MAKATKQRTPEQQAKIDARMAKMRAARQNKNPQQIQETELNFGTQPEETREPTAKDTVETEPDVAELMRQIKELKDNQFRWMSSQPAPQTETPGLSQTGNRVGTFEKYGVSPQLYPTPTARLSAEPKLARFAFDLNYELDYKVSSVDYTTIDNVRTREPRFTLELIRIRMDEETGEPTDGRYVICRLMMHEDPETALVMAREQGIDVEEYDEEAFLNEMRYIRMRDWLVECFYPAPVKKEHSRKDMVVNNRIVTYYEVNNEEGKGLSKSDWDSAPKIRF